ncbi:MAG: aldehyde ferredoxin oxidoreductase family protein [Candidatus Bipolaricaulota bacterium]|nr:aldehyde ferredoxin oxidoreductase family protein [Candidatus Bipolaricaulota bacterium]MBS3791731.1 aldehyde ferredoxin oxidoreductase family protein [Candidatus Bipolaricaulota bacterium]
MQGYFGRYLDVSLADEEIGDYPVPEEWYEKFLGGRGIGARIMVEELESGVDPLGPENIMVFATGPLQGLNIAGAGRHLVMAKSPKTNSVNGSYVGGFMAQELGKSGYDGIIIRGQASGPKYLVLKNGEAGLKDAEDLWGLETAEFEYRVQEREGDVKVASIGKAGENLIDYSCLIFDRNRAAGRPGFGAVLGGKKLKGIAVKGEDKKDPAFPDRLKSLKGEFAKSLAENKADSLGKYGTSRGVDSLSESGLLPTKNFQRGEFSGAEEISGETMADTILKKRDTCSACPIRCKRVVETEFDGEQVRPKYGGPEYETVAALGSLCLNSDLDSIALANQKCNRYGLDTISTGNTIAFAMEASEKGLLDWKVDWGDPKEIVELVEAIANKEGIGKELARGISELKEELGADFAVEIKGQEVPMHEPRGKKALGISYATTPRGANHMEGPHDTMLEDEPLAPELGVTEPMDRYSYEGKAEVAKIFEDLRSFNNSLVMCAFTTNMVGENYSFDTVREMLKAVTGQKISPEDMLEIGERNYLLLRLLASREGYTAREDRLPERLKEPLPSGATEGEGIPEEKLDEMLSEYYELRGYDEDGMPTREILADLGIEGLDK